MRRRGWSIHSGGGKRRGRRLLITHLGDGPAWLIAVARHRLWPPQRDYCPQLLTRPGATCILELLLPGLHRPNAVSAIWVTVTDPQIAS